MELGCYPTNDKIDVITNCVSEESDSLIALLGMVPSQLRRNLELLLLQNLGTCLMTRMMDQMFRVSQRHKSFRSSEEHMTISRNRKEDETMANLTSAALAVMADEMTTVYVPLFT
jgi:hypothetical protein